MARSRPRERDDFWDDALPRVGRLLPPFLLGRRWFGGKGRRVTRARLIDRADLRGASNALLTVAEVTYADRTSERYLLPLAVAYDDRPGPAPPILRHGAATIRDGFEDEAFCRALLRAIARGAQVRTARGGTLAFEPRGTPARQLAGADDVGVRLVGAEQSNTSVIYGDRLILKAFRRVQEGTNPEIEILRFLAERTRFDRVPALAGWAEYRPPSGSPASLAVLEAFVANHGDGWSWTLRELGSLLGRPDGAASDEAAVAARGQGYFDRLAELGRVTAGLHLALASSTAVPAFAPRPIDGADVRAWRSSVETRLDGALARLRDHLDEQPEPIRALAGDVLASAPRLRELAGGLAGLLDGRIVKTRLHGDYHLGQVLTTADSFVILDFEGEPLRPLAERRALHTPLKDVAGLLRSLNYARHAALRASSSELRVPSSESASLGARSSELASAWERLARRAFLDAYLDACRAAGAPFLPRSDDALRRVLAALELDKAAYELEYELDNRPDWLAIPLQFLGGR